MDKGKTVHKRALLIAVVAIAAIAILSASIYFLVFPTLTVVSDPAFDQVLPRSTVRHLGLSLALKGIRLKVDTLESASFDSANAFVSRLGKLKGRWVLLGPLSSAFSVSNGISVSDLLPSTVVIAMYGDLGTSLFDCTLVSDAKSGWIKASESIASELSTTSRNTALIYEKDSISFSKDIKDSFRNGWLSVFEDDGQSKLFASETLAELDRQGIVIAMCPRESRIQDFFKTPTTLKWVVDYRLAPAIPSGQLYGMVVPSFEIALSKAMGCEKGSRCVVALEYEYEKL